MFLEGNLLEDKVGGVLLRKVLGNKCEKKKGRVRKWKVREEN